MTSSLSRAALIALAALALQALAGCTPDACNNECPTGQHCDADLVACVPDGQDAGQGCLRDGECTGSSARRCQVDQKRCVQCLSGSDCASGKCDTSTFTCTGGGCTRPEDCTDATHPFCAADGRCVECRTQNDCQPANGVRRSCDLAQGKCVAHPCAADADCASDPAGSVCAVSSGACVQCTADSQCADRRCDPASDRCVDCLADADCKAANGETCDGATHSCKVTGCANDLACDGARRCDTASRACVDCLADSDCVFGGRCNQGVCQNPAACSSDGDCLLGGHCVSGACLACAADADCRLGQTCQQGVCQEPASCAGSAKDACNPGRTCEGGSCKPASCTADAFEPNDTPAQAKAITEGTLNATLCPSESDLYRIALSAGEGLTAVVHHDAALGPARVELVSAPGAPPVTVVGGGDRPGVVTATLESAPVGTRAALVRVVGPSGAAIPYELDTTIGPYGLCADDGREPDNSQGEAPVVAPGIFTGTLCPAVNSNGEMDWIALDVPEGLRPVANLTLGAASSRVTVEIFTVVNGSLKMDAVGDTLVSRSTATAAAVTVARSGGQRYWVVVRNKGYDKLPYTLRVDARAKPPANDLCANALPLAANATQNAYLRGAADDGQASCGGQGGEDAFWTLTLTQPSQVTLDLVSNFDAVLALAQGGCTASVEEGCTATGGGTRRLSFAALPAGSYVVRVDSSAGQEGTYSLATTVSPAAPAPANESCDTAQALAFSTSGSAQVQGSVALAADDVTSSCGQAGGDAVYAFHLDAPRHVAATLSGFPGASVSLVPAAGCASNEGAHCAAAAGTDNSALLDRPVVEAGDWMLVVDGGSARAGSYTLSVQLSEALFPPPNDSCASPALALAASQTGDLRGAADDFAPSCGKAAPGAGPGDAVYRLVVTEDTQLTLDLTATFDAAVAVTADPCSGGQSLACSSGRTQHLVVPALAAGTYWVWVDGYKAGETGTFTLTSAQRAALPLPTNDTCQAAQTVDLTGGSATVTGSTIRAQNDVEPAQCTPAGSASALTLGGPDVVYQVTVPAGRTLNAVLTPAQDFDGALYVLNGCGQSTCVGASDQMLQAGGTESVQVTNSGTSAATWQVVVDSFYSGAAGDFSLALSLQ